MTAGHDTAELLDRVARICLSLPETTERDSHGAPAWWVRERHSFALFADHHRDDRLGLWCAAAPGRQVALVQTAPQIYYRPPYLGRHGWIGVRLDRPIDWPALSELINDAHDHVAARTRRSR